MYSRALSAFNILKVSPVWRFADLGDFSISFISSSRSHNGIKNVYRGSTSIKFVKDTSLVMPLGLSGQNMSFLIISPRSGCLWMHFCGSLLNFLVWNSEHVIFWFYIVVSVGLLYKRRVLFICLFLHGWAWGSSGEFRPSPVVFLCLELSMFVCAPNRGTSTSDSFFLLMCAWSAVGCELDVYFCLIFMVNLVAALYVSFWLGTVGVLFIAVFVSWSTYTPSLHIEKFCFQENILINCRGMVYSHPSVNKIIHVSFTASRTDSRLDFLFVYVMLLRGNSDCFIHRQYHFILHLFIFLSIGGVNG